MKKIFTILCAAFGIFAASSCNKNEIVDNTLPEQQLVPVTIQAGAELTDTKTYIDAKQVLWQSGDDIAVFTENGSTSYKLTLNSGEGTTAASFEGSIPAGATSLCAVYPYAAAESLENGNTLGVDLPAAQTIEAEANVAQGALVAVANGVANGGLQFKNVFGLIKVTITADNVKAIVVNGTNVAGEVKVNAQTGEIVEVVAGKNSVTATAQAGCFDPGDYYVAVLPGTSEAGAFSVSLVVDGSDIEGVPSAKMATLAKEITVPRNGGFKFSDTAASLVEKYVISTAEEFVAWNGASQDRSMNAMIVADIDMKDVEWTPSGLVKELDGQNHCIYNFVKTQTSNVGLFSSLSAGSSLKNIILGSKDGETYDGVSCVTLSNPEVVTNNSYAGGFVGYINGKSTIENCKNFAKVQIDAANVTKVRLGGIAGGIGNFAASIIGCENAGEVYAPATTTELSDNSNMGGIIAWSDGSLTIKDTRNCGYVHTSNKRINRLCGILGGTNRAIVLDNCDNSGAVKYETSNNREVFISGIVGDVNHADAVIKNCDNTGAVTLEDKTAKSANIVEMAGVCSKLVLAKEFSNNTNAAAITNTVINSVNTEASGIIVGGVIANVVPAAETSVTITGCKTLNASNVVDNFSYSKTVDENNVTKYIKLGGIAAQVTGAATFEGCSNAGLVQKIATDFGTAYLGGIVGFINTGSVVDVKDCSNTRWVGTTKSALGTGDITATKGGNIFIGGICGSMKGEATFTGCLNKSGIGQTGSVDGMYGKYVYFGGIVGNAVNTVTVTNCTNSGEIKNLGKVLSWVAEGNKWTNTKDGLRIGGIIGALNAGSGKTGTITGCTNTGTVTNESTLAKERQELGGILGYCSGGYAVVNDCISNATIKSLNATLANINSGELIGYISGNNVTANNNGVAGKIIKTGGAETVITADNFADCLWTLAAGKTVTTTTPNYFYTPTKGLQNATLGENTDNLNW